jgi:hypothetical protein
MTFLTTGTLPTEYEQTVAAQKASKNHLKLKDLDIRMKGSLDVSGSDATYAVWKTK